MNKQKQTNNPKKTGLFMTFVSADESFAATLYVNVLSVSLVLPKVVWTSELVVLVLVV
jgi:hypothetical protein